MLASLPLTYNFISVSIYSSNIINLAIQKYQSACNKMNSRKQTEEILKIVSFFLVGNFRGGKET